MTRRPPVEKRVRRVDQRTVRRNSEIIKLVATDDGGLPTPFALPFAVIAAFAFNSHDEIRFRPRETDETYFTSRETSETYFTSRETNEMYFTKNTTNEIHFTSFQITLRTDVHS
jgi:hypothetical protein